MFGRHRGIGGLHAESTQGRRRDRLHVVQVESALRRQHVAHRPLQPLAVMGGHVGQDEGIDRLNGATCQGVARARLVEVVGPGLVMGRACLVVLVVWGCLMVMVGGCLVEVVGDYLVVLIWACLVVLNGAFLVMVARVCLVVMMIAGACLGVVVEVSLVVVGGVSLVVVVVGVSLMVVGGVSLVVVGGVSLVVVGAECGSHRRRVNGEDPRAHQGEVCCGEGDRHAPTYRGNAHTQAGRR